jgi:peptide deformylase
MSQLVQDEVFLRQKSAPVRNIKEGGEISRLLTAYLARHNKKARNKARKPEVQKGMVPGMPLGLGISAPQIGILKQVAYVYVNEVPVVLMNPRIIEHSEQKIPFKEGCLSFPNRYEYAYRWSWVVVECLNHPKPLVFGPRTPEDWNVPTKILRSVVVQHEIGHLRGLLFWDFVDDTNYPDMLEEIKWKTELCGSLTAGTEPTPASIAIAS